MYYRAIFKILGTYFFILAGLMLVPLSMAVYYENFSSLDHPQPDAALAFLETIFLLCASAAALSLLGRHAEGTLFSKEGVAIVVAIWCLTPAFSALPFYLSGTFDRFSQAYFEAVSGFTTTGATMMQAKQYDPQTHLEVPIKKTFEGVRNTEYVYYGTIVPVHDPKTGEITHEGIEAVGKALLFWRSFMQFLGGGGIIVLFVAVLPALGVGGKMLLQTEVSGPIKDSLTPRIKETAIQLWKIYIALTALQALLLMHFHPETGWFDAITISFSTLSTGGFSVKNASIGAYASPAVDWIVILFMTLGSINFSLFYFASRGKIYRLYDIELLLFIILLGLGCGVASWYLIGAENLLLTGETTVLSSMEALRYGAFQVVSAQSSTGFASANYDTWPYVSQVVMLIAMYLGGMSGSTAGGIKIIRHYMLFRIAQFKIESLFRPYDIRTLRVGDREVPQNTIVMVLVFFLLVLSISVFSTFIYIVDGIDPETAIGLVACMINNTGLAFRMAGPAYSCAFLSEFSTYLSSFLMLLGRLEFFAVLAVLSPAFWKTE